MDCVGVPLMAQLDLSVQAKPDLPLHNGRNILLDTAAHWSSDLTMAL